MEDLIKKIVEDTERLKDKYTKNIFQSDYWKEANYEKIKNYLI